MTEQEREEILAEIDALAGVPQRQPSDVSLDELVEMWGVGRASARTRMDHLVERGLFDSFLVYDPDRKRQLRVWRRADGS